MKRLVFYLLLILNVAVVFPQGKTDSLTIIAETSGDLEVSLEAMIDLADIFYINDQPEKMYSYISKIDSLMDNRNYKVNPNLIYKYGSFLESTSDFQRAVEVLIITSEKAIIDNNIDLYLKSKLRAAYLLSWTGDYEKAISIVIQTLKYIEENKLSDFLELANVYAAFVFRNSGEFHQSRIYFLEALEYGDSTDVDGMYHVALHELGNMFNLSEDFEEALKYQKRALAIREQLNLFHYLDFSYNDIAATYRYMGDNVQALDYLKKSMAITIEKKQKWGMASAYLNIASVIIDMGNYEEALLYLDSALVIAEKSRLRNYMKSIHNSYYLCYKKLNDFHNALLHYEISISYKDSIQGEDIQKQIKFLNAKFESEKKDKEIIRSQIVIKRQNLLIIIFIIGVLIIGCFLVWVFYVKQKLKRINLKLNEQNQIISLQKEEIESQRDLVIKQKSFIENQKKKIDDSIIYAQHIQSAMLPSEAQMKSLLGDYFIIFRPKEVVSGDFFWVYNVRNYLVVALVDCTGHGVSGAFMSMLGVSFLNDIIKKKEIVDVEKILENLRTYLNEALSNNADSDMKREGMYVNLLVIDKNNLECNYAGARTPLWIYRSRLSKQNNFVTIDEIKPENPSVALHKSFKAFTGKKIFLSKGDVLYLFTDGIIDQFGGREGKKYSSRQLLQVVQNSVHLDMNKQKLAVEDSLENWQNPQGGEFYDQIDDITFLSMKVS